MTSSDQNNLKALIEKLHNDACKNGELTYLDPVTGYTVITEFSHLRRGYCCKSGCRHCPWKKVEQKNSK